MIEALLMVAALATSNPDPPKPSRTKLVVYYGAVSALDVATTRWARSRPNVRELNLIQHEPTLALAHVGLAALWVVADERATRRDRIALRVIVGLGYGFLAANNILAAHQGAAFKARTRGMK